MEYSDEDAKSTMKMMFLEQSKEQGIDDLVTFLINTMFLIDDPESISWKTLDLIPDIKLVDKKEKMCLCDFCTVNMTDKTTTVTYVFKNKEYTFSSDERGLHSGHIFYENQLVYDRCTHIAGLIVNLLMVHKK